MKYHSNKITAIIPFLPPGSIILADAEFDVEENYLNAKASHMDLQVKLRKGDAHKYLAISKSEEVNATIRRGRTN